MPTSDTPLVAAVLTEGQLEAVAFYQALNVPASWFVGTPKPDGSVEVIALGEDSDEGSFIWSFSIDAGGHSTSYEATASTFSTGINV